METSRRFPNGPRCLALDGHDGSGKSSIAAAVAERLGYPTVKPYPDVLGDVIATFWRTKRYGLAFHCAQTAVEVAAAQHANAPGLVFDRLWLTMFTVLPKRYRARWVQRCPTVLCWTDVPTTVARLTARGEDIGDIETHRYYCERYRALALAAGVPIVDTTALSVEQAADQVMAILDKPDFWYAEGARAGAVSDCSLATPA